MSNKKKIIKRINLLNQKLYVKFITNDPYIVRIKGVIYNEMEAMRILGRIS